jgi:glycolate oxidase iron-sulfur subunit
VKRDLASLESEIVKCIRCGACQVTCPVFRETGSESAVARGKLRLLRAASQGELELDGELSDRLSLCLMCKACTAGCPSGVKTDKLVEAGRTVIRAKLGLGWRKTLIFRLALKNRGIFRFGLKMGSFGRKLLFRPHPSGNGVLPRLSLGIDKRRLLQPLAAKSFLELQHNSQVKLPGESGKLRDKKVALFTGCMVNYLYVDIGTAVVRVLEHNGIEVTIPTSQHCCGTPVRVNGDLETAISMAKTNIDVFYNLDVAAIVVPCASCGLTLKTEYPELLGHDPVYADKAKEVADKVKDFSEFMVSQPDWQRGLNPVSQVVTYHDPCHLARGQGIRREPRTLIQGVPRVKFYELALVEQCCGSAGSFSLSHPELSQAIGDQRSKALQVSGADLVISGCPACLMQLQDGISRNNLMMKTQHIAEFLDASYRNGGEN